MWVLQVTRRLTGCRVVGRAPFLGLSSLTWKQRPGLGALRPRLPSCSSSQLCGSVTELSLPEDILFMCTVHTHKCIYPNVFPFCAF